MRKPRPAAVSVKQPTVVKFGRGFPVYQEDKKIVACKDWKNMGDHFNTFGYEMLNPNALSVPMDTMEIVRGRVSIKHCCDSAMLYETAFQQLLSTLELPNSIAERMPVDVLSDILNGLIRDSFTRKAFIKMNNGAIYSFGFWQSNRLLNMSAFRLFEYINRKETKSQHKFDFLFGISQGLRSNIVMKFADYRDKDIGGAVEILFSDALDCKPRVTGIVVAPKGHIFIRNLSFTIDTDDEEKAYNMVDTYINKIHTEIDAYVQRFSKMETTKLSTEATDRLKIRASKCLRNSTKKPLKLETGWTVSKVFDSLLEHRQEKNDLMAKRDISYFASDLLELCK